LEGQSNTVVAVERNSGNGCDEYDKRQGYQAKFVSNAVILKFHLLKTLSDIIAIDSVLIEKDFLIKLVGVDVFHIHFNRRFRGHLADHPVKVDNPNSFNEFFVVNGFDDISCDAGFEAIGDVVVVLRGCQCDDRDFFEFIIIFYDFQEFYAVHFRHIEVKEDDTRCGV
jgi:hypothetical protein